MSQCQNLLQPVPLHLETASLPYGVVLDVEQLRTLHTYKKSTLLKTSGINWFVEKVRDLPNFSIQDCREVPFVTQLMDPSISDATMLGITQLGDLLRNCLTEQSFSANLITLCTVIMMNKYGANITTDDISHNLCEELTKSAFLSKDVALDALKLVSLVEAQKIYFCSPRMIVVSGYSSECTKFDVRGDIVCCGMGVQYCSKKRLSYFEVTLLGKKSFVKGIRIGWAKKSAEFTKETLGSDNNSWVLDLSTGKFFHCSSDALYIPDGELNSEIIDGSDNNMFGDLFSSDDRESEKLWMTSSIDERISDVTENFSTLVNSGQVRTVCCLLDNNTGALLYYGDGIFTGIRSTVDLSTQYLETLTPIVSSNLSTTCEVNLGQVPFKYAADILQDYELRESISDVALLDLNDIQLSAYASFNYDQNNTNLLPLLSLKDVVRDSSKSITFEISVRITSCECRDTEEDFILFACSQSEFPAVGGLNQGCAIGLYPDGKLFFEVSQSMRIKTDPNIVKLGDWSHISVTYTYHRSNGTADVLFYVNGHIVGQSELSSTRTFKLSKLFPKHVVIGTNESYVNGNSSRKESNNFIFKEVDLCNIRIWSSSRSNDRVISLMHRDKLIGSESELLFFAPCNEGFGDVIYDVSKGKSADKALVTASKFDWKMFEFQSDNGIQNLLQSNEEDRCVSTQFQEVYEIFRLQNDDLVVKSICALLNQYITFRSRLGDIHQLNSPIIFEQVPFRTWITPTSFNLQLLSSLLIYFSAQNMGESHLKAGWRSYAHDVLLDILGMNILYLERFPQSLGIDHSIKIDHSLRKTIFKIFLWGIDHSQFDDHGCNTAVFMLVKNIRFFYRSNQALRKFLEFLIAIELGETEKVYGSELYNCFTAFEAQYAHKPKVIDSWYEMDTLCCVVNLSTKARRAILDCLCGEMVGMSYWKDLISKSEFRSLCSRDSMVSSLAQNKSSSTKARLRRGSLVKRGPDWRYGDEDGGVGSVGVILDFSESKAGPEGSNVMVVWSNSYIDSYRWNIPQQELKENIFDLSIVELDDSDRIDECDGNECSNKDFPTLKYTPDEVVNGLLMENKPEISKQSIFMYILEVAPNDWLQNKAFLKNGSEALSECEICDVYRDLYHCLGGDYLNNLENIFPHHVFSLSLFAKLLQSMICKNISKSSAKELLKVLQYVIVGCSELNPSPAMQCEYAVSLQYDKSQFEKEFGGADGKFYAWNWSQCSWNLSRVVAPKIENASSINRDPMIIHAKIIARFSFDRCEPAEVVQIRSRSRSCDITMMGNKEWITIVADMPLKPNTGNYIWYVKIRNMDRRSRFSFGVVAQNQAPIECIGQNENSWGITQNLEYCHNGERVAFPDEDHRLLPGSTLEINFDTSNGHLRFLELTHDEVFQMNMEDLDIEREAETLRNKVLHPAFSFFAAGDSISLVTDPDEIKVLRGKFSKAGSLGSAMRSNKSLGFSSPIMFAGSPPPQVVEYVSSSLRLLCDSWENVILSTEVDFVMIVLHSLAMMCKWTAPPLSMVEELKEVLVRLLKLTSERFESSTNRKEFSNSDVVMDEIKYFMTIIVCAIGKLCSYLIRYDRFICLNSAIAEYDSGSNFNSFAAMKQEVNDFISSDLLSSGFRQWTSPVENLMVHISNNDYQETREVVHLIKIAKHLYGRLQQRVLNKVSTIDSPFQSAHLSVFIVFVYHLGMWSLLQTILEQMDSINDMPLIPSCFVHCWDCAHQVFIAAIDNDRISSRILMGNLVNRAQFVVQLEPFLGEVDFNGLESIDSIMTNSSTVLNIERATVVVKKILLVNLDAKIFETVCSISQKAAKCRSDGFKLIKTVSEVLCQPNLQEYKTLFMERMSMTLKGLYSNWVRSDFTQAIGELKRKEKSWYYFDGIRGIPRDLHKELKGSFELMVGALVSDLNTSELTNGHYQLSLLSALAFRLESCDHELLLRVNFFRSIHELMENLLQSISNVSVMEPTSPHDVQLKQLLMASIKLFIFIARQVASFGQDEETWVRSIAMEFSCTPALRRIMSGPSTLNNSVFDILFHFLTTLGSSNLIKESSALVGDCVGLLLCVSKHSECQSILSSPKWIELIISYVHDSHDDFIVQKLLLTLSDILMVVKPDGFHSFGKIVDGADFLLSTDLKPAELLVMKLLQFVGSKIVGLRASFNKKGVGICNFGALNESIAVIRKLHHSLEWKSIIERMMNLTLSAFSSSGGSCSKLPVIGLLTVLGGPLHTLYPSCPVEVKLKHGLGIGVIKGFAESSDMVEICCCKVLPGESKIDACTFNYGLPIMMTVPVSVVSPLYWENGDVSVTTLEIILGIIAIANQSWGSMSPCSDLTKSNLEDELFQIMLLKCIFAFMVNRNMDISSLQRFLTTDVTLEFFHQVAEASEKASKIGGPVELCIHEQYLVSLISIFNTDPNDSFPDTKHGSNVESVESSDDSSSMVETLVNMGFPRKLCILALQICGGDAAEALNYILSNGSALVEMLKKTESRSDRDEGTDEKKNRKLYCYKNTQTVLYPFYSSPSLNAERIGAIFPGDQMQVVEEKDIDGTVWFRVPLSELRNQNLQNNFGEEIKSIFVWIPKFDEESREVIVPAMDLKTCEEKACLDDPPIAPLLIQRSYRVIGLNGALVRSSPTTSSEEVITLCSGTVVNAVEETINREGTIRLRITSPVSGWISKIPGLLERISDQNFYLFGTQTVGGEIVLLQQLEDNFECLTGTDVFCKEERFFGNLQGVGSSFVATSRLQQSLSNKKQRIYGVKSFAQLFGSLQYSSIKENLSRRFEETVASIRTLLCRNLLLAVGFKFLLFRRMIKDQDESINVDYSWMKLFASKIAPNMLLRWIQFVAFREDPCSHTGLELLTTTFLERLAWNDSSLFFLEERIGGLITSFLDITSRDVRMEFQVLLVDVIAKNLKDACDSKFQDLSWVDATYEEDMDTDIIKQPNIHFALWGTNILLESEEKNDYILQLLQIWMFALRGTSMSLKFFGFKMISKILRDIRVGGNIPCYQALEIVRSIIAVDRLMCCASRRIWMEMEDAPSYSRFLQSFVNFLFEIHLLSNISRQHTINGIEDLNIQEGEQRHFTKAISLGKASSHVKLLPQRDLPGSWTLEVWLQRRKGIAGQDVPYLAKKSSLSGSKRSTGSSNEKRSSLSSLLQLLLGKDMDGKTSNEGPSAVPVDESSCWCIDPCYLLSSSKFHIKIQKGGRVFSEELSSTSHFDDTIEDEAYCVSIGQVGYDDKVFDCVVPFDRWVHLSIVVNTHDTSSSIFLDGHLVDSQHFTMQFPIGFLGTTKFGHSFSGRIQNLKVWNYARSQEEIIRNMRAAVRFPTPELLVHLSYDVTSNEFLYDKQNFIVACKHIDCTLDQVEDIYYQGNHIPTPVLDDNMFTSSMDECNGDSYELTGFLSIPTVGQKPPLMNGIREIVVIYFSMPENVETESSIRGYVLWNERNVKTLLHGKAINKNGQIQLDFISRSCDVLFGSPEKLNWLQTLSYTGPFHEGKLTGPCTFSVKIETNLAFAPGTIRVDLSTLPGEVALSENGKKCNITTREGVDVGQYLVYFHISPHVEDLELDDILIGTSPSTTGWNGITKNKGSIWIDFLINSSSGEIAFGLATFDALIHPDASVDANEGTWTYSSAGSASHGFDLFLSDTSESGDVVSLHLNTDIGLVRFYKNDVLLIEFTDLLDHECMSYNSHNSGLRPFVNLVSEGDSVTLLGTREGPVVLKYSEDDPHNRKIFVGNVTKGSICGEGLLQYRDNGRSGWYGKWENDRPILDHIHIQDVETSELIILESVKYDSTDNTMKPSSAVTHLETHTLDQLKEDFYKFRNEQVKRGVALLGGAQVITNQTSSDGDLIKVSINGSGPHSEIIATYCTAPLKKVFDDYALIHDCSTSSFQYHLPDGDLLLDGARTAQDYGLANGAVICARAISYIIPDKSVEDPVEVNFPDSSAKYVVQIVYESGATVRDGIEIEESAALRTLQCYETVEAFQKSYTSEGIGRYRIPDGWISEKLRGRIETPVIRLLRELFGTSELMKFRISREGGIKLRSKASLQSVDLGQIPTDTIVMVSERRQIFSQEESSWINRLFVCSPEEYRGWISEKPHLVIEIKGESSNNRALTDSALLEEIKRRSKIRLVRQTKKIQDSTQKKRYKSITVVGELHVSAEIFFLLKRSKFTESSVNFATDFTSIKCSESGGRSLVLGSRGFSHGVHYWEVEVKSANWGSVFIGVAPEESTGWNGFGFINYRATQAFGNETIYGTYFGVNDKIGVLLDMDRGTISFFKDGEDFNVGKVTVIDMGVAYHNLRKTSSRYSASQMLFPCFGMKSGDELSIKQNHWISQPGYSSNHLLSQILESLQIMYEWHGSMCGQRAISLEYQNDKVIDKIYLDYVKKCRTDKIFMESRPGIPITICTSNDEFCNAVGREFAMEHNLGIGVDVATVYGKAIILGTSPNRRRVWYSSEQSSKRAWYWLVPEFKALVITNSVKVGKPSPSFVLSTSPGIFDSHLILSKKEFTVLFTQSMWTIKDESDLVEVINQLGAHMDKDPIQLSVPVVLDYLSNKKICKEEDLPKYIVRFVGLCFINKAASLILPFVDLSMGDSRKTIIRTVFDKFDINNNSLALPCATRDLILSLKRSIFTTTKIAFWHSAIQETTTPTAAPADEYERPEEIREIPINRIQARNAIKKKDTLCFEEKLKISVFGQLMDHIDSWEERNLRKSYVHMQDAGQSRGFFVKFVGEGVDDQGGPYRAVFQTVIEEEITGFLQLITPCPNASGEIGDHRDKFLFNHSIDLASYSKLFVHMGCLVGIAARHKVLLPLSLAPFLWKALTGECLGADDLRSVDVSLCNSLEWIISRNDVDEVTKHELLVQALVDSAVLCRNHHNLHTNVASALVRRAIEGASKSVLEEFDLTCENIVEFVKYSHIISQNDMLQYFFKGLSKVVPTELLSIFTPRELETLFCGESEMDLDILKKVTVYESVNPSDRYEQFII